MSADDIQVPRRGLVEARARAALPLTPIAIHILLALVDRDRHGLGIAADIEDFTGGRVVLGPGNLYGTIKKLLALDLIDDVPAAGREAADPRRRYYHLTAAGRRALEIETRDLANTIDVARLKRVIR